LDQIYATHIPANGRLIRNLLLGAEFLQNHLRHFYILGLPDFVEGSPVYPFLHRSGTDYRFSPDQTRQLWNHYLESVEASRMCHEMAALWGGKMPHPHGIVPGGATVVPKTDILNKFAAILAKVRKFIDFRLLPDTRLLADTYSDYYYLGQGPGNFLSYGGFLSSDLPGEEHFPAGVIIQGVRQPLDIGKVTEKVDFSWFEEKNSGEDLLGRSEQPDPYKEEAYTWVETPRYENAAMEVGPLARAVLRGEALQSSAMARIVARSTEAAWIGEWMSQWLGELHPGQPFYKAPGLPVEQKAWGLAEVPRGGLLHGVQVEEERIIAYKVITPSEWNYSPRDRLGKLGVVEQSLIGIPIRDIDHPIEVGRVVRSFDPCLYCATHLIKL
jgi:hydrogenase large subunit